MCLAEDCKETACHTPSCDADRAFPGRNPNFKILEHFNENFISEKVVFVHLNTYNVYFQFIHIQNHITIHYITLDVTYVLNLV